MNNLTKVRSYSKQIKTRNNEKYMTMYKVLLNMDKILQKIKKEYVKASLKLYKKDENQCIYIIYNTKTGEVYSSPIVSSDSNPILNKNEKLIVGQCGWDGTLEELGFNKERNGETRKGMLYNEFFNAWVKKEKAIEGYVKLNAKKMIYGTFLDREIMGYYEKKR